MPGAKSGPGVPSRSTPMSPVATPMTAPCVVVEHFGGGKARIDLDAERLGLGRPASGRHCRARRCSCRDCSSAAASGNWAGGSSRLAPSTRNWSSVTGVLNGWSSSSRQPGSSRSMPIGSTTAPDRICAPTSAPFSSTTTESSGLTCFSRIAAARPAGPAPTMTTSNSMLSRSISLIACSACHSLSRLAAALRPIL